jgi:TrmH family RNA methyltransferase
MSNVAPPPPLAVVLVRPREEGNLGAVCRAMANMGIAHLHLVEPAAPAGPTAQAFAVGARGLLERATRHGSLEEAIGPYSRVVGTTSARDRRIAVPLWTPRELAGELAAHPEPTALVFGPEVGGLDNDELSRANAVVTIPAALAMPTLNLAQSVLIVAYELFLAGASGEAPPVLPPGDAAAPASEVEGLLGQVDHVLHQVGFARSETYGNVLTDLHQLAGRARLTEREVKILRGALRRTVRALTVAPSS